MKYEEDNLRYINNVTQQINDLVDDIYEALVDSEYELARSIIPSLIEIIEDLQKSITNEI
jgi:RecA-family ATPase